MSHVSEFKITSIEPTTSIFNLVQAAAKRFDLNVEFQPETTFSAPFCGTDYYVQQVRLLREEGDESLNSIEDCLKEIAALTEQNLADAYFETCE